MTDPSQTHSKVSAYIMAYEAPRVIDFMRDVLGGEVLLRLDRDDGTIMHASVNIGGSTVMISDGSQQYPSFPVWMHVYVDDVDATYTKALEWGAEPIEAPASKPDGDRRGGVKDKSGNIWWFAAVKG